LGDKTLTMTLLHGKPHYQTRRTVLLCPMQAVAIILSHQQADDS
jgi:hypothetical protein